MKGLIFEARAKRALKDAAATLDLREAEEKRLQ